MWVIDQGSGFLAGPWWWVWRWGAQTRRLQLHLSGRKGYHLKPPPKCCYGYTR